MNMGMFCTYSHFQMRKFKQRSDLTEFLQVNYWTSWNVNRAIKIENCVFKPCLYFIFSVSYMILKHIQLSQMIYGKHPHFFRLQEILESSWGISRPQQNIHAHPSSGPLHPSSPAAGAAFTAFGEDKLVTQAGKLGLTHAEKLSGIKGIWYFNLFLQTSHCPYQKLIATILWDLSTQTTYTPHWRCITIKVPNH